MSGVKWRYGNALREPDGTVWDHELFLSEPVTKAQLEAWNAEHAADCDDGSVVVAIRSPLPEMEVWEPTS